MNQHPEIHYLVQGLAVRSEAKAIVILSDNYESVISQYPPNALIYLLHGRNLVDIKPTTFPPNILTITSDQVNADFLKNKVFLCIDYLENKSRFHKNSRLLKFIMNNSALTVVCVDKKGQKTKKIDRLFGKNGSALIGSFKGSLLVGIGGLLTDISRTNYPELSVLAIITQFNEGDIIEPVIEHLLTQGVDVHIIDNWSEDGSYEAVQSISRQYPDRVSYERYPKKNSQKYEWSKLLARLTEVAKERPEYEWIISNDADEIRWSPWEGVTLQRAISFIDHMGYNTIDYTVFNFQPTKDGFKKGVDPLAFFEYGKFGSKGWHFMQLKTWRNNPLAEIASSGGHLVTLPATRIFPFKFLLGHYSLRSNAQARKKIFKERKPRFIKLETEKGWHSHYDQVDTKQSFIRGQDGLIRLYEPEVFQDYLVERISGVGIEVDGVSN